jgi:hypothetical protein
VAPGQLIELEVTAPRGVALFVSVLLVDVLGDVQLVTAASGGETLFERRRWTLRPRWRDGVDGTIAPQHLVVVVMDRAADVSGLTSSGDIAHGPHQVTRSASEPVGRARVHHHRFDLVREQG